MRTSLTFGKIAGIPLKLHINWFLTVILVTWSLAEGYFPQTFPGWGRLGYWSVGLLTSCLFFGSVLIHELGHSMVALREGIPVNSITLFVFGGVAHIANEPETSGSEFRIVAAGPLASLVLAGLFKLLSLVQFFGPVPMEVALYLSQLNLVLAVFNLIPGFPLDGGRILRAFLWRLFSNFKQATRWAANIGIGIAILFVLSGLALFFTGNFFDGAWIAFIGWYLSITAQEGYRQTEQAENHEEAYRPVLGPVMEPTSREPAPVGAFPGKHLAFLPLSDPLQDLPFIRHPSQHERIE